MTVMKIHVVSSDPDRSRAIATGLSSLDADVSKFFTSSHSALAGLEVADSETVILIDQHIGPMTQWDLIAEMSSRQPAVPTIAVLEAPQSGDYARALSGGARGVLSFPISYDEAASVIGSATSWSSSLRSAITAGDQAPRGGHVVAVSGAKGGVGTSSIALHLALTAKDQRPEAEVVIVDLDLQKPDQAVLMDIPHKRGIIDIRGVVDELTPRHLDQVLYSHPSGIKVLLGPERGEESELISSKAAQQIISLLASRYDIVVIDTGSVMGEANSTALEMAEQVVVVTTPDVLALRGVHRLTAMWKRIGVSPEGKVQVVLNHTKRSNDLHLDSVRKIVNMAVLDSTVPQTPEIEIAVNRRQPADAPQSFRRGVLAVAAELGIVPAQDLSERPSSRRATLGRSQRSKKKHKGRRGAAHQPEDSSPLLEREPADAPERGAVSIEFLAVVPLVGLLLAAVLQMILVGTTWIFASHAANEGARAAAVGQSAHAAAVQTTPTAFRKDMQVSESAGTVTVRMDSPTLVPKSTGMKFTVPVSAGIVKEPW